MRKKTQLTSQVLFHVMNILVLIIMQLSRGEQQLNSVQIL